MNYILAKGDKQLGICLRMLYPEQTRFKINPVLNERRKMEFQVFVDLDDDRFEHYKNTFDTLTS